MTVGAGIRTVLSGEPLSPRRDHRAYDFEESFVSMRDEGEDAPVVTALGPILFLVRHLGSDVLPLLWHVARRPNSNDDAIKAIISSPKSPRPM